MSAEKQNVSSSVLGRRADATASRIWDSMSWLLASIKSLSSSSAGKLITFDGNGGPEVQVLTTGLVAEGGYSFVYSAREVAASGRCFAVKKVIVQDKEMRDSAEVELFLLRIFSNTPGFVKCYGGHASPAEPSGGRQEYLMLLEYCPNGSLVDLLYKKNKCSGGEYEKRAPLDEPRVLHVFGQVAAAVAHMHAQIPCVSHRDLKLENVLCTADGRYVLCDFGSAVDTVLPANRSRKQAAAEEERISKYSTLHYRAPEMCDLWRQEEVGPKADVWALGCILYCLAFGDHPFPADSPLQILNAAWSFPAGSGRSPELHELIRRTLAPDPANRPSASEVVLMVDALRKGKELPRIHHGGVEACWTATFEEAPFEANSDDQAKSPVAPPIAALPRADGSGFVEAVSGPCAELPASTAPAAGPLADEGVVIEPFADFDALHISPQAESYLAAGESTSAGAVDAIDLETVGGALKGLAAFPIEPRPEIAAATAVIPVVGAGVAGLHVATSLFCGGVSAGASAGPASAGDAGALTNPAPASAVDFATAATGAMLPDDAACTAGSDGVAEGRGVDCGDAVHTSIGVADAAEAGRPCASESGAGHTLHEAALAAAGGPWEACGDGEEDAFGEFTSSVGAASSIGEASFTPSQFGEFTAGSGTSPVILKLPLPAAALHSSATPAGGPDVPATPPIAIKLPSRPKLRLDASSSGARARDACGAVLGEPAPAATMSLPVGPAASGSDACEGGAQSLAGADNQCEEGSLGSFGCHDDSVRFAASVECVGDLGRESDFGDFAGAPRPLAT